jgi:hypothetical protein
MRMLGIATAICFCLNSLSSYAQDDLRRRIAKLSDSIKVGDLVIYNAFKRQVLAHGRGSYDSLLILNKVYKPHPELWNKCLSQIFGKGGKL